MKANFAVVVIERSAGDSGPGCVNEMTLVPWGRTVYGLEMPTTGSGGPMSPPPATPSPKGATSPLDVASEYPRPSAEEVMPTTGAISESDPPVAMDP